MTNRTLKWVGLADSEYISRCGSFMVQLQDKDWYLFRRVEHDSTTSGSGLRLPKWGWSISLFSSKRKGACQNQAELLLGDTDEAPEPAREEREPRQALTRFESFTDTNATCHECGVPFMRAEKHKWGALCGENCYETMKEIIDEIDEAREQS